MDSLWAILPRHDAGDADKDAVYRAVGVALSSWEMVEQAVADIFVIATGGTQEWPSEHPAIRAYGSVASSRTRVEMVRSAALAYLRSRPSDKANELLNAVLNEVNSASARRNEIAHGRVVFVSATRPGLGHYLVPGLFATRPNPFDGPERYAYNATQILIYAVRFGELESRVREAEDAIADLCSIALKA
jgi:hypothetical protein